MRKLLVTILLFCLSILIWGQDTLTYQFDLDEVEVHGVSPRRNIEKIQIGAEQLEISEMSRIPTLFGEKDILKALQLLPGVQAESDGSSGYQVRGGTSAQNSVLLDDATIYQSGHLMGFFSSFNGEALQTATLYKGQVPAQYTGGTASVLNLTTRNGDFQHYHGGVSIGLLLSKLQVEGPIWKNKMSFKIDARRSYADLIVKLIPRYRKTTLNFWDINARFSYNINERNKLYATFFIGRDNLGLINVVAMNWGNIAGTVHWQHSINEHWSNHLSAVYSDYVLLDGFDYNEETYSMQGWIRQAHLKDQLTWEPNDNHHVIMGYKFNWYDVTSGEWKIRNYYEKDESMGLENSAWLNDDWQIIKPLSLSMGLRVNVFTTIGEATHWTIEPRFSLNYKIMERMSLKTGYGLTSQNIQAIRNLDLSMPFDRYLITSAVIKPQTAHQVSLGYTYLTPDEQWEFSAEGYYKHLFDVADYKDGTSFTSDIRLESLVLSGEGRSYGAEFMVKKTFGDFTGWAAYTLSWTQNHIAGINYDRWYYASQDRRHSVNIVLMYKLPKGWSIAATWVYNSGQAMTIPLAKYHINGYTYFYYSDRNAYRAPDYHRLDLSADWQIETKKHFFHEVNISIYNVYNRYNPFIIQFENSNGSSTATQWSLFGIVPSVSYTFKF